MKSFIFALCLVAVVNAAPRANHAKVVSMEENEIPQKRVKGAAVEFGGLRAGAGLGGSENGGGLWASAELPGQASAGAGLYGGNGGNGAAGASAGSSSGGYGGSGSSGGSGGSGQDKDGFFDRIFAIPINVLHSVNTYVKSKQQAHPGQGASGPVNKPETGDYNKPGNADYKPDNGGDYGFGSGPNAQEGPVGYGDPASSVKHPEGEAQSPPTSHGHHRRPAGAKPDYDKIFNIPISALKSVNDFLNG